ncbi:hypothetical protein BDW22DRAFT_1433455 [Trametopsis cervina]|nr:hypothetical protein BDW22DRAFT_1433455 [Trametopsis cervina]
MSAPTATDIPLNSELPDIVALFGVPVFFGAVIAILHIFSSPPTALREHVSRRHWAPFRDSNMNSTSPLSPELHAAVLNTFGPIHLGSTASIGLLGITILQAWLYYYNYPDDSLYTKLLVALVCVVEFIRSSFTVHAAYYYLVLNWGNPAAIDIIVWSIGSLIMTTQIAEVISHLYFSWRIWTLSRLMVVRWTVTSLVVTLTIWDFAMGTGTPLSRAGSAFSNNTSSLKANGISAYATGPQTILSPLASLVTIVTDFAIMLSLIFLLNRYRNGLSRTNYIVKTLIFYSVQAGMLTVLAEIAVLALNHYVNRIGFEYLGVHSVVGNLYANSLLASLNARGSLRFSDPSDIPVTTNTTWQAGPPRNTNTTVSLPTSGLVNNVQSKEEYHLDMLPTSTQTSMVKDGHEHINGTPMYELGSEAICIEARVSIDLRLLGQRSLPLSSKATLPEATPPIHSELRDHAARAEIADEAKSRRIERERKIVKAEPVACNASWTQDDEPENRVTAAKE